MNEKWYGKNSCTYCGKFMGYNAELIARGHRTSTCSLGCHLRIMDNEEPLEEAIRKQNYEESKKRMDEEIKGKIK